MTVITPTQISENTWRIEPRGEMRVPAILYADHELIEAMDHKVFEQVSNVAALPGIVQAAYAMPDAHWGYGFPIGGVAAFDPDEGGVISAGGVGFDISCGVRTLHTSLSLERIQPVKKRLADELSRSIPAGVGSTGRIHLSAKQMRDMLQRGARWAVEQGYGPEADLERTEEHGYMAGADPTVVSDRAKQRQMNEMGTLGSGNHYLEVQVVTDVYDETVAASFSLKEGDVVVSIHCGSRGLGHQIGTEFLKSMALSAGRYGIRLPDRELACAPLQSDVGRRYLGAMRAGINCALANRQILTHLTRQVFEAVLPEVDLLLLYDVSHNTCKEESHEVDGHRRRLFVHRKGATRALGPGHRDLPMGLREVGQPVLIGGSMGTGSYILAGTKESETRAFSSSCHGAGRAMSRRAATKRWRGGDVVKELETRGILIRSPSLRGVAEEAPQAYKDVNRVVDAADRAGLSKKVARLEPLVCIKG
ncbi:MAG: RtcB family protein [Candidatus Thiodiazotropha sp. (ex Dulcina madagascariensis)]|nr:RtcB family protein [Candidatus Thiodiazotropha sp. (ex Dulcina madagascariensis)]MCU7925423.1 RtcB family protein [Candidatus Thiodiazotropha sp. (ex Dulcina madagascariensis)]